MLNFLAIFESKSELKSLFQKPVLGLDKLGGLMYISPPFCVYDF